MFSTIIDVSKSYSLRSIAVCVVAISLVMELWSDELTSVTDAAAVPVQSTLSVADEAESLMRRFVAEFRDGLYTYRRGKSATLIGVYAVLFVASVVGNIGVLTLVLPFRRMRSVTHYFIVNLAVADLLRTSLGLSPLPVLRM